MILTPRRSPRAVGAKGVAKFHPQLVSTARPEWFLGLSAMRAFWIQARIALGSGAPSLK
jgi:hypothetical protein